ncbi:MAG TPA: nuclear transport factor 2 family protein [Egibacteraceae bacterium]|nr:nuclear transport factor 2 family protein [Egibacteraceae bacterium]
MTDTLGRLLTMVGAGFEGDADEAADAFAGDAVFVDQPGEPPLRGPDEIREHFLAFGGRRERFLVGEVVDAGDRAAVEYAVAFRADAHAYGQRGVALIRLRDGLIASWRAVWVETDEDLSHWGND